MGNKLAFGKTSTKYLSEKDQSIKTAQRVKF